MSVERINPPELYDSVRYGFSHATLQTGGKTLHLAGQVAWDAKAMSSAAPISLRKRARRWRISKRC